MDAWLIQNVFQAYSMFTWKCAALQSHPTRFTNHRAAAIRFETLYCSVTETRPVTSCTFSVPPRRTYWKSMMIEYNWAATQAYIIKCIIILHYFFSRNCIYISKLYFHISGCILHFTGFVVLAEFRGVINDWTVCLQQDNH